MSPSQHSLRLQLLTLEKLLLMPYLLYVQLYCYDEIRLYIGRCDNDY